MNAPTRHCEAIVGVDTHQYLWMTSAYDLKTREEEFGVCDTDKTAVVFVWETHRASIISLIFGPNWKLSS